MEGIEGIEGIESVVSRKHSRDLLHVFLELQFSPSQVPFCHSID